MEPFGRVKNKEKGELWNPKVVNPKKETFKIFWKREICNLMTK